MSNQEFENYMALVSRLLRLNRAQEQMIRDELRDHLEFRVADLVESGADPDEAVRKSLEEFGDAASLAQQFQSIFKSNQKRWMMRFATFSVAGTFVAVLMIMAMWPSPAHFGAPSSAVAVQDKDPFTTATTTTDPFSKTRTSKKKKRIMTSEDVDAILNEAVSFQYDEVPFADFMDDLRGKYNFNIVLDTSAIDDSLTEDTLMTYSIDNVRMATALRLLLKAHNATYVIDDGVLLFISLDVASDPEFHRRRVFDCRKLLTAIDEVDPRIGKPMLPAPAARGGGFGGGGGGGGFGGGGKGVSGGGGGVFNFDPQASGGGNGAGPSGPQDNASSPAEGLVQNLLGNLGNSDDTTPRIGASYLLSNLIINTVVADEWAETNGDGTLEMIGGLMVVNQTEDGLDQIERLLDELERRMKTK